MLILLPLFMPLLAAAQGPVALCTEWLATVDDSQHIVLRWNPSADPRAAGYNICTGDTCRPYHITHDRYDTSFVCRDHSATERHTYRLHVFDSADNPSALTPHFGNIVVNADIPRCDTTVRVSWNTYRGMPGGVGRYSLMSLIEPYQDSFTELYATSDSAADGILTYSFVMPEVATRVNLKVRAISANGRLTTYSNTVSVERGTVDSAAWVRIDSVVADSLHSLVLVHIPVDTAFVGRYTLWRSIDGTPWNPIAAFTPHTPEYTYIDRDLQPYRDSLHCYQLSVSDGCGMNTRYSSGRCAVVPEPPPVLWWFPNTVVAGDEVNGTFLPVLSGLNGDLYELYIYNRGGLLVFHTTDPAEGWRPGADIPQGAYAYTLRVRYIDNRVKTHTGIITVIK